MIMYTILCLNAFTHIKQKMTDTTVTITRAASMMVMRSCIFSIIRFSKTSLIVFVLNSPSILTLF